MATIGEAWADADIVAGTLGAWVVDSWVEGAWFSRVGPVNLDAVTDIPSNYELCDRTNFRVEPHALSKEWSGLYVRPRSFEERHPQDLPHSASPDKQTGSPAPELDDRFLTTNEVQPEDL